jgi:hypothetical protein
MHLIEPKAQWYLLLRGILCIFMKHLRQKGIQSINGILKKYIN